MTKRRAIPLFGVFLLAAVGVAAALLLTNRREVTTSSEGAYRAYREAVENERRFYFKEAQAGFAKALELDPEFSMAMAGLARFAEKEQSLSLLRRANRLRSRLNERERLQIDLQLAAREKGPDEQLKVAREILSRYPNDFRAASIIAHHEKGLGHDDEALKVFARLLEADPNNADAYNLIGYHHGYRGDYEKAIESLKKYQFMAPDQANPHDSLGEIQAYSGHYDEAIANLNRALTIKPDFYPAYDHLGVAYEGKGEDAKAIESYFKAAEHVPLDMDRFNYLAKVLRVALRSRDQAAAESAFARIQALPKNPMIELYRPLLDAGRDLLEGRPAEAERRLLEIRPKLYEEIVKRSKRPNYKPYHPGWNYLMARAKVALGKNDEAISLYEEMASPPNGWEGFEGRLMVYEARAQLAALLARHGELERAEKLLEENHRWNPSWAPTRPAEQTVAEVRRARVLASAK
ncbi:MAG TPA: tetratricopeptide repeat protein [Thermoanaerobaculia bacterium]